MTSRQSELRKCIDLGSRKACVILEADFWDCLEEIAARRGINMSQLLAETAGDMSVEDLSAALRVFVLENVQMGFGLNPAGPTGPWLAEPDSPYTMPKKQKLH